MGFYEKEPLGGSQEPAWVNTSNGTTVGGGLTCPRVTTAALVEAIDTQLIPAPSFKLCPERPF